MLDNKMTLGMQHCGFKNYLHIQVNSTLHVNLFIALAIFKLCYLSLASHLIGNMENSARVHGNPQEVEIEKEIWECSRNWKGFK